MTALAALLPLGWIGTPVAVVLALGLGWILYRAFVYPALDPLRVLPGPRGSRLFGVLPEIMREQTCAPQMRWVEKVRVTAGAPSGVTTRRCGVQAAAGRAAHALRLLLVQRGNTSTWHVSHL